ncbi:MAG TPA: NAD(P)H-dependent glycerol-3-phosphate dehydrogenase [Acidimicrobiales bacterium]|nr:NAD(P)H-dependent glycerol-3-phosphate dehydrogenase [Acidimicrobiales bacterium]
MAMRVAVIGAGSWGTTVATLAARNTPTVLWARREELAAEIDRDHVNSAYLPGVELPPRLEATSSVAQAIADADVVVMAVPSHGFRDVLTDVAVQVRPWVPVISLSKGFEQGTRLRMTEIVNELMPGHPAGVLTGPNLAKEVVAGQPAGAVLAMADERIAEALQPLFGTDSFRIYTNPDIVGCEVAGALKNVMAIAAGMIDGMGFGDNTRATLMTRGLAELTRLGVALGGEPLTFSGLAGMGDLVATCSSTQSRNHHVGEQLGLGRSVEQIIDEMNMVAEGVKSSKVVCELAEELGVEMPIAEQVEAVCHRGRSAAEALTLLMQRQSGAEMHGLDG